ncbi:hypothetical protein B0H13DRAFT_1855304 [Mycena leptocephala]|nr:hypothetical protein B0H13DRAFT_1855304 [Mycena leptocephala]
MPPRGQKAHGGRNISGLRNQKSKNSLHLGTENNTDTEGEPPPTKPVQDSLQEGDAYGSEPEDDCWLSDQGFTNLANIFANSDGEQDLPDNNLVKDATIGSKNGLTSDKNLFEALDEEEDPVEGGAEDDTPTETNDRKRLRKPTTRYKDFWRH